MKKIAIVPALIMFFVIYASADVKYDASYSVNNYKHRNKVEVAVQFNLDNLSWYTYTGAKTQSFDNYKNNFTVLENHGGFIPEAAIDLETGLASSNNYKLQNKNNRIENKNIEQPNHGTVVFNMK